MATWDSLAPELHHIIFSFFCNDIVTQYEDSDLETVLKCQLSNLSWPTETAQSLIDFSSALCVSRSFHQSLLHFKVGGERVVKILQSAQRERCATILEQLEPEPSYSRRGFINVRVFMLLGGVFWKNPLVRGDVDFMWSVLSTLSMESLFMLLPHLEEWVLQHAVHVKKDRACSYISREYEYFCNEHRKVVFQSRYWNGPDTSFGSVVAIDGLYKGGQYKKEMDHRSRIRKTKVTESAKEG
jgi:hypothetical protein